jgi:hypothetical protein
MEQKQNSTMSSHFHSKIINLELLPFSPLASHYQNSSPWTLSSPPLSSLSISNQNPFTDGYILLEEVSKGGRDFVIVEMREGDINFLLDE